MRILTTTSLLLLMSLFTFAQLGLQDFPVVDGAICIDENATIDCSYLENQTIRIGTDVTVTISGPIELRTNTKIYGVSPQLSRIRTRGLISIVGEGVEIESVYIQSDDAQAATPSACWETMPQSIINICNRPELAIEIHDANGGTKAKLTNVNFKYFKSGISLSGNQEGTIFEGLTFERVGDLLDKKCNNELFGFFETDPNDPNDTEVEKNCDCLTATEIQENHTSTDAPCGDIGVLDFGAIVLTDVSNFNIYNSFHHVAKHATTILVIGTLIDSELIGVSCEQFGFCARAIDFANPADEDLIIHQSGNRIRIIENLGCPRRIGSP